MTGQSWLGLGAKHILQMQLCLGKAQPAAWTLLLQNGPQHGGRLCLSKWKQPAVVAYHHTRTVNNARMLMYRVNTLHPPPCPLHMSISIAPLSHFGSHPWDCRPTQTDIPGATNLLCSSTLMLVPTVPAPARPLLAWLCQATAGARMPAFKPQLLRGSWVHQLMVATGLLLQPSGSSLASQPPATNCCSLRLLLLQHHAAVHCSGAQPPATLCPPPGNDLAAICRRHPVQAR